MRVLLYGNGSCGNHGCEAIYRGTINLLGRENQYILYSSNIEDLKTILIKFKEDLLWDYQTG